MSSRKPRSPRSRNKGAGQSGGPAQVPGKNPAPHRSGRPSSNQTEKPSTPRANGPPTARAGGAPLGQVEGLASERQAVKLSDVGQVRPHNEDFVDAHVPADPEQLARKGAIYLVADGMGGHQAGEVASQGAVEIVIREYYADMSADVGASLVRAFKAANQRVYEQAQTDASKVGMGTTLVAAVALGSKVYIANVGDSRAYLINQAGIAQITEDHSWVEEQVRAGLLTPDQARRHPQRNLVTRALGTKPAVEVDLFEGQMNPGDMVLLCTDGLSNHVSDKEVEAAVRDHPAEEAARLLVATANERGGTDNITVLIVGGQRMRVPAPAAIGKPAAGLPLIPILAAAAAVVVLIAALFLVFRGGGGDATVEPTDSIPVVETSPGASATAMLSPTVTVATTGAPAPMTATAPGAIAPAPGSGTPGPTETLKPTATAPAPATQPPTATPQPAQPSRTPGSLPTLPLTPFPPPILLTPLPDADLQTKTIFAWQWDHVALGGKYYFDLRIWSPRDEEANLEPGGVIEPTKDMQAEVDLEFVQAIEQYGPGTYYWTVVVVQDRNNPRVVGDWGETRRFRYSKPGGAAPSPAPSNPPPPEIPPTNPPPEGP